MLEPFKELTFLYQISNKLINQQKEKETMSANSANRTVKPIAAIREYFGLLPGETAQQFLAEVKALSKEERLELAQGAADNLRVTLDTSGS